MEDTQTTSPQKAASPRRPFRFSILTLLGLTALFALVVALFAMMGERARWKGQTVTLREELRQLRETHQLLDITDSKKIYVRAMVSPFQRMGQWRVHLPEGSDYRLKYDWKDLPPDRDPHHVYRPYAGMKLPPGTYTIAQTFQFTPSSNKSQWHICITASKPGHGGRIHHGLPVDAPSWIAAHKISHDQFELPPLTEGKQQQVISFRTYGPKMNAPQTEYEADEEASLIRWEAYEPGSSGKNAGGLLPQEVFRLWIEKVPTKPAVGP